jgi:hypothetical protein
MFSSTSRLSPPKSGTSNTKGVEASLLNVAVVW